MQARQMCEDCVAAVERVGARRRACCGMGRRGIVFLLGCSCCLPVQQVLLRLMSLLSLFGGAESPLPGEKSAIFRA